jgi:hypothetical protein
VFPVFGGRFATTRHMGLQDSLYDFKERSLIHLSAFNLRYTLAEQRRQFGHFLLIQAFDRRGKSTFRPSLKTRLPLGSAAAVRSS